MTKLFVVVALLVGCGGSSKPAPSNTSAGGSAEPAKLEANGMCNEDGTCGGQGTCLALCEGKTPGDPGCEAQCEAECAKCPNHKKAD